MTPGPVVGLVVLFHLGSSVEPEDLKGRKCEFSTISTLWLLTRILVFLWLHSFLYGAQACSSVYVGCMVTFSLNDMWRELWEGLACEAQRLLVHTLPSNTALLTTRYDASHVIMHSQCSLWGSSWWQWGERTDRRKEASGTTFPTPAQAPLWQQIALKLLWFLLHFYLLG